MFRREKCERAEADGTDCGRKQQGQLHCFDRVHGHRHRDGNVCVERETGERFGGIAQTLILGYVPGGQDIPLKHPQPERITYTELLLTLSSYMQCKHKV